MTADEINTARDRVMGDGPVAAAVVPEAPLIGLAGFKLPSLTFVLLGILVAIFAAEYLFAVSPSVRATPSLRTLFAMGGLNRRAVVAGHQWYRLFAAPALHGSFPHILGNGLALLMSGWLLERMVGRLWFFAIFVIGALGGSLLSLAILSPNLISVGASGAITALFAALLVSSFRLPAGSAARRQLQYYSLRTLVPALLPLLVSASTAHIDYGAHLGGALSGTIVAALLLASWPPTERIPQFQLVATGIVGAGIILFVASAGFVIADYQSNSTAALAIPAATTDGRADYLRDNNRPSGQPAPALSRCELLFPNGQGAIPGINCLGDGRAEYLRNNSRPSGQPYPALSRCATLFPNGKGAIPGINCSN